MFPWRLPDSWPEYSRYPHSEERPFLKRLWMSFSGTFWDFVFILCNRPTQTLPFFIRRRVGTLGEKTVAIPCKSGTFHQINVRGFCIFNQSLMFAVQSGWEKVEWSAQAISPWTPLSGLLQKSWRLIGFPGCCPAQAKYSTYPHLTKWI